MSAMVGVLLLAYGTPASPDEIESYYTHIRHGHPPTPELLAELTGRYRAIGGGSPLLEIAQLQVSRLEQLLREQAPGTEFRVVLGCKHATPFIEDAVAQLAATGADQIVAMVLAPHYSALSVGEYATRVREAAQAHRLAQLSVVEDWHLQPGYISLLADRVHAGLAQLRDAGAGSVRVLFTAHSLPSRILGTGDPYPEQLEQTAGAVAASAGLADWSVAWQSAGRTAEPWIGPDVRDVVRDLGKAGQHDGVLVCAAGFVSDHLEILYDLDIDCRAVAQRSGLRFARTASLNADPGFIAVLAQIVADQVHATVE